MTALVLLGSTLIIIPEIGILYYFPKFIQSMSSVADRRLLLAAVASGAIRIIGGLFLAWLITFLSSRSVRSLRDHAMGPNLHSVRHLQREGLGDFYRQFVDLPTTAAPIALNFLVFVTGALSAVTFLGAAIFLAPVISISFLIAGMLSQTFLYRIRRSAGRASSDFIEIRRSFVFDAENLSRSLSLLVGLGKKDFVRHSLHDLSEAEIAGYRRQEFFSQVSSHVYIGLASSCLLVALFLQSLLLPSIAFDAAAATASFLFIRSLSYIGQSQHCWIWLARVTSMDAEMRIAQSGRKQSSSSTTKDRRQEIELSWDFGRSFSANNQNFSSHFVVDLRALQFSEDDYLEFRCSDTGLLEIQGGSLVGIRGNSGVGKSTLLETLTCSSDVFSVSHLHASARRPELSFVPQGAVPLTSNLNRFSKYLTETRRQDFAHRPTFDCSAVLDRLFSEGAFIGDDRLPFGSEGLSGGQEKRLATIWSLLSSADIHLLDEPTSGLDSVSASEVVDLLSNIPNDRLIIASTHDQTLLDHCHVVISLGSAT